MQRRTRRSASTIGGAAPDTIIGRTVADRAGARPYRATRCENASKCTAHFERNDALPFSSRSRKTWLFGSMILNFSPKKLSNSAGKDLPTPYGSRKVSATPQLLLAAGRIPGRSSHSRQRTYPQRQPWD